MNLKSTLLTEKESGQKEKCQMTPFLRGPGTDQPAPHRHGEREHGELPVNRQFLFWALQTLRLAVGSHTPHMYPVPQKGML